ncbi:MAG: monovalent cation/H+ antiporter complex subunit F [Candidatus Cyclobacteriaceae bacterium M3_2C_046]
MTVILYISLSILSLNLLLTLVRFVKGPSMPDRIIALDVFAGNLIAILAVYSILAEVRVMLDIAVLFSLITFLGTMTFAYYLVQSSKRETSDEHH